jgi:hypothetical protein
MNTVLNLSIFVGVKHGSLDGDNQIEEIYIYTEE